MVERRRGDRPLMVLFGIYLILLTWVVLWKAHVPYIGRGELREIKLVPFVSSGDFGARAPWEVLANVVIFFPFGLYLARLAPRRRWWWQAAAMLGGVAFIAAFRGNLVGRAGKALIWTLGFGTVLVLLVIAMFLTSFPQLPPPYAVVAPAR